MTAPIVPSSSIPVLNKSGGISTEYQRFFNLLPGVGKPAAIAAVALTGSPYQFVAADSGTIAISGGTVSAVSLVRNGAVAPTGITAGLVTVQNGDIVKIVYASPPTVNFIPG